MRNLIMILLVAALVLSAALLVTVPAYALSERGGCRAANGGIHGQLLADWAQTNTGISRGPDACGSLAPPL